MTRRLLRRLGARVGTTALVLIGVTVVVFLLLELVPGDPARAILGTQATDEAVAAVRAELGLDKPLPVQYADYIAGLLHGDMGRSYLIRQPVADVLMPRFGNTMILTGAALLVAVGLGVPIGILAAVRQYSLVDRAVMLAAMGGANVPVYWLAIMLVGVFAVGLGWFPTSGMQNLRGGGPGDLLAHLVLPAISASLVSLAVLARLTRSVMVEELSRNHIRTLRAAGIRERSIVWRHALRNSLPQIVNVTGLQVGYLLGGVVFVEVVFAWPGIGYQLYTSISQNDIPVVQGGVLFIALSFVLVNMLADLAGGLLDPRSRRRAAA